MTKEFEPSSRNARRSPSRGKDAPPFGRDALFEGSPYPIWILDLSRRSMNAGSRRAVTAIDANRAASAFHGAPGKPLLLASCDRLLGPDAGTFSERCAEAAGAGPIDASFEAEVSTLSGARRSVRATLAPAPGCELSLERVYATFEDVTVLRRAEAVGRARLSLLDYSLSHGADELMREALDRAEELTRSRIGFFHIVADDGLTIVLQSWSTRTLREFCRAEGKGTHYDIDRAGVWVECAGSGRPVIHNDYASLPSRKGLPRGHAPVIRELTIPILRGDRVSAILGVGNKETPYDEGDAEAASRFADFAWEIVERKRTEETLRCLSSSFASLSGRAFYEAAARRIAEVLFVDMAMIARYAPGSESLSVLGAAGMGGPLVSDELPMAGSPFQAIASGGEPAYGDGLGELFPSDELVSSSGARSLAVRILGRLGGKTILAAAWDSRPMPSTERLDSTIALFKDRILAEVARDDADRALEVLNAGLAGELRERSLELESAAKLAMLGRLVAGIAHELSTPLAAISSAVESLGESLETCIPGLPGFLGEASRDELGLFSRLVAAIASNGRTRNESEHRARKRRWRAVARDHGIGEADAAIETLAELGIDPSDEELVRMLRVPRAAEIIGKAFLIARSLRASSVIGAAAAKASRTLRALKTYAHDAPSDRLEEVDLRESVESTLSLYFEVLPAGTRLSTAFEPTPPVLAQPDRLSQVWSNLVANAIQASPGGAEIAISVRREGERALVSVADAGPGIPEEAKERIFTPFFTTKAPGEGLGLGLDICKRIVEETGGRISFESERGRTIFTVELPLAEREEE